MRFPTSVGHRLFLLVASQTTVAILLVVMALRTFGGATSDYRHMYGFQVMPIIAIGAAMREAATLQPGTRSPQLDAFYNLYRRQWETVLGNTPDAIRFRKDLLRKGQTVLPQMEANVLTDLSKALQTGDVQSVQDNLSALQDINIRYASVENQCATDRLASGRSWLLGIGIVGTLLIWLMGLQVAFAIGPRIRSMVARVRRFQESGNHEKIGDTGKDDIAVLANALDAGFMAITSRDQDRERFLSIAAHELKTPITTIQGYASFLVTHPQDASYTSRALEIINRQSRRLSRLIESVFLAVRARSGDLNFDPKPLNLSVLVERVLQEMEPFLAKNTFQSQITENISILGDESLLEHALWCLFTCAVALSPAKAPIPLSLARRQSATLTIDIQESDIPMQEVLNLFLPFRSLQYETDGLRSPVGLYLSREIVRMHNGQLYVHPLSEFNPEFLMELPT